MFQSRHGEALRTEQQNNTEPRPTQPLMSGRDIGVKRRSSALVLEPASFDKFRYGLASLLVRCPNLRARANAAQGWADLIEEYADAVRFRDKLRVEGGDEEVLAEYETICSEIESELEDYLSGRTSGLLDDPICYDLAQLPYSGMGHHAID